MRIITAEEKIGECIRAYGNFEYEKDKPDDDAWRIILDASVFVKAVYVTISFYEKLEKEDLESIRDIFETTFIKKSLDSVDIIRRCPSQQASFPYEPFFLRLVYIAFREEKNKKMLVSPFIEISYYLLEYEHTKRDCGKEIKEQSDLLEDNWKEKIIYLYRKYAKMEYKAWVVLQEYCTRMTSFIENITNKHSAPFHPMLNH